MPNSSKRVGGPGGKRPGAGRKPKLERQLELAKKVAQDLQEAQKAGLRLLGGSLEAVYERALRIALDEAGDQKLSADMLKFLIAETNKLVKLEPDEQTPFERLMREKWAPKELHLHQHQPAPARPTQPTPTVVEAHVIDPG